MATETTQETTAKVPDFTFNKKTEVMIGRGPYEKYDKVKLSKMVYLAHIDYAHKLKIWDGINKGNIDPKYFPTIKSILEANAQGSVYRAGSGGF